MGLNKETAEKIVATLNRMLKMEPYVTTELFNHRYSVGEECANDPTIQVRRHHYEDLPPPYYHSMGMLGLINGIVGDLTDPDTHIAAVWSLKCNQCGAANEDIDRYELEDCCPKCNGGMLILDEIEEFRLL